MNNSITSDTKSSSSSHSSSETFGKTLKESSSNSTEQSSKPQKCDSPAKVYADRTDYTKAVESSISRLMKNRSRESEFYALDKNGNCIFESETSIKGQPKDIRPYDSKYTSLYETTVDSNEFKETGKPPP